MGPLSNDPQNVDAQLYETDTGLPVLLSDIPITAMTPSFSPSGKWLAFNDAAANEGHSLALMKFDPATRKATQYREVFQNDVQLPGWPFVLPDDAALVFALGAKLDFSGMGATPTGDENIYVPSDLMLTDLDTEQTVLLARAMGFADQAAADADSTYLPFGMGDLHQSFYPTVSPVGAGGYFWIFFDSVRHYGVRGRLRGLWGAAITVSPDGSYASDPSHPAFFLPGQEETTANHRAFTALDPCLADGASCETGIDCCGGFCTDGVCASPKPDEPRCSQIEEGCSTAADCCSTSAACIAGFCTLIVE